MMRLISGYHSGRIRLLRLEFLMMRMIGFMMGFLIRFLMIMRGDLLMMGFLKIKTMGLVMR
jgi:hypothetical protein